MNRCWRPSGAIISESSTLEQTTARILADTRLLSADAADMSATGETFRR